MNYNYPAVAPIWLPFLITYGVITLSLSTIALVAYRKLPLFRTWFAQPINKFWLPWIIIVVCSGGMIAMMLFPGADMRMGWGMLKYDGAFKGAIWIAANEVNTQIIVLCFTSAALVNHPPAITEMFLTFTHPTEIDRLFPRMMSLTQRRTFLFFANCNCFFMYPLTFSTWMIPVSRRPFYYTAAFLPLSLGSGIAAGVYMGWVASKNKGLATLQRDGEKPQMEKVSVQLTERRLTTSSVHLENAA